MGRKMLLIAPLFFGYYKEIISEARIMGLNVTYVCDAPSNTNISKAMGRINKKLIMGATKKYFRNKVLPIMDNSYDYVLLIAGMTFAFSEDMISEIREKNQNARFIMYQWDSEVNLPYSTKIHKFFDVVYTFERSDCESNKIYNFLPFFYSRTYEEIADNSDDIMYDCSYIGTAHPRKYKDINDISNALLEIMPKQFIYHYMPSKLKYIYHKLTSVEYRNAKITDFYFEKISTEKVAQIFCHSKCILDAQQDRQNGLTARTMECIGAKRKLITTNADIINYEFYVPENIYVYNGKIDTKSPFFKEPYVEISPEIYKKYSLRNWLKTLISFDIS